MTEFLDLGPHAGFILACYAITLATIAGLFVWLAADRKSLTASLAKLEADGVRRRSGAASSGERG
ncbi:heme exporter protein CcmD [Stappia indica]|uniref:Heme exporter protein D n=1 Tax=Stappia indica TaxID=538381 RepID=A0A285RWQ9_9HYPH|nr:heme exporter protein CcmD [Stappia indica]MCC4244482.1 heme exporter protein CcmD [Stappia indica]SOB98948.1 heme exporter protein D [Stappia indica]